MSKKVLYFIICIFLIVIFAFLFKNYNNNEELKNSENTMNENVVNNTNTSVQNLEAENISEDTNTSLASNTVQNIQNVIIQDNLVSSPEKNIYESEKDIGSTNKKQEAINLVKEYWGEDDTVNFTCDSVTSNGEYIIAVISKKTASVSGYFRVNIENKTVEVDY